LGTKLQAKGIVRHSDRITYLDNAEYEGILTPGVGQYNVKVKYLSNADKNENIDQRGWNVTEGLDQKA
jgi:hypothetical protein